MTTVKIKMSTNVLNKNHQLADGLNGSLNTAMGDILGINEEINSYYDYSDRLSYTASSITFSWFDGTKKVLAGRVLDGDDWSGQLLVKSETTIIPRAIKETITGNMIYDYNTAFDGLYVELVGGTINSYKAEALFADPDFGTVSTGMTGTLSVSGNNLSGTVDRIYQTGTKYIKLIEATGSFAMSGAYGPGSSASLNGTLNSYRESYVDGSYVEISGAINVSGNETFDQSYLMDAANWAGDDDISLELPSLHPSSWIINSGTGNDKLTLKGGGGNGSYIVANAGDGDDHVILLDMNPQVDGGDGHDTLELMVSGSLAAATNFEVLKLGGRANIHATGSAADETLIGNAGANTLDGAGGGDVMIGGAGNDVYIVDDIGDVITEELRGGTDTVRSVISYTLGSEVENLVLLAGAGDLAATGNALKNTLTGNEGNNILDGGIGADVMIGGFGNDTYFVDNTGDKITERAGEGSADRIETTIAKFTLAKFAEVEQLAFNGVGNAVLTGNKAANVIEGGAGNDTINGMQGADTMIGGSGDDVYYVDDVLDVVTEGVGAGMDTLHTSVSYSVTGEVERIFLTGRNAINVTGSDSDNAITGNAAINSISALDGNDILDGLGGNDTLTGGLGDDIFRFTTALGVKNIDTVSDFTTGEDSIEISAKMLRWKGALGEITADQFVIGTAAVDADDRFIYDSSTGTLSYDADGSGRGKAQVFALLTSAPVLSHDDIVII